MTAFDSPAVERAELAWLRSVASFVKTCPLGRAKCVACRRAYLNLYREAHPRVTTARTRYQRWLDAQTHALTCPIQDRRSCRLCARAYMQRYRRLQGRKAA